jgi:hypothetical protein
MGEAKKNVRVAAHHRGASDGATCNRCQLVFSVVWTLDVLCPAIPARKHCPATPEGWAPLVALCEDCWKDVIAMLPEWARGHRLRRAMR